jgi:hypothetical protein
VFEKQQVSYLPFWFEIIPLPAKPRFAGSYTPVG